MAVVTAERAAGSAVGEPLIRMRNLRKVYRKLGEEFLAVSDVTLDIFPGDLVSLVGPSGCGKTTLLKILSGLQDHDGGTLEVGGGDFNPGRDVGMVFQQPLLLKWRTVLENVLLPAEILNLDRRDAAARAHQLLEMVGLAGNGQKYPYELSGGMQQRAAIARALIHSPKLVLMDEPFGALDEFTRERMNVELLRIWEQRRQTIVFVTHSIAEAVFLADRIVVMGTAPGRVLAVVESGLPRPRGIDLMKTPQFADKVFEVREYLGVAK